MLEDGFRSVGVRLHCADEPFEQSFASVVMRHVNISLARGYHHELTVEVPPFRTGERPNWASCQRRGGGGSGSSGARWMKVGDGWRIS
jgi:hypothetical protein